MKDLVDGRIHNQNLAVTTLTDDVARHFLLAEGDILLNRTNSYDLVGKVGYLERPLRAVFASYLVRLVPDRSVIDSRFLVHWLTSSLGQQQIKPLVTRAVSQANLNPTAFCKGVQVPVPPLEEQSRIAEILSTWDDAIRLSELIKAQLTSTYKAAAQVYLCGRRQTQYRLEQLLIPDQPQIVEPEGPFPALGVRSHGKGTIRRIEALSALDSGKTVYRVEPNRFIVNIVFAWEGAAAITSEADEGCLVSHRFPMFTVNPKILSLEYFRHVIRTDSFRQLLALASPGGAGRNKTLNRGDLLRFQIGLPSLARQVVIASMLNDLDRKISVLAHYIVALKKQRDALATELLTGRLRVPLAAASGS